MDKMKIPNRLDISLYGDMTKVNDITSKCRVRIFYKGLNRNRTFISEEFANKLIASLPYVPIKGIFDKDDVDYTDHGWKNSDGKIYGIVPENPNFAWEKHLDEDGVEREYACCDVIVYTALYPEAKIISGKSQSMEIYSGTLKGRWNIWEDGDPYFDFEDGCLLGLQVLGDMTEPCFEGAAFFSLYNDAKELIDTIKNFSKKDNNDNKKVGVKKPVNTNLFGVEAENFSAIFAMLNPNYETEKSETFDSVIFSLDNDVVCYVNKDGVHYNKIEKDEQGNFALGESVDPKEMTVLKDEIVTLKSQLEEAKTTSTDDDKDALADFQKKLDEKDAEIANLKTNIVEFEKEKTLLSGQISELSEFKSNIENTKKEEILDKFSEYLNDSLIDELKGKMDKFTVDDFKKEVCATAYDNSSTTFFSKKKDESDLIYKVNVDNKAESGIERLLDKYKNGGNK